jgi:hypothetical protein
MTSVRLSYADPAVAAFVAIPVALVCLLVWAVAVARQRNGNRGPRGLRIGALAILWMALTWAAAQSGVLRQWGRTPPPFAFLVVAVIGLSALLAFGRVGRQLVEFVPLWALVAVQGFRLPLELAMHQMYERGVMPRVMSYSGRNFDIVTGTTAILVGGAVLAGFGGTRLVARWNFLGLALLLNVITVAVLATPRFHFFPGDRLNVWVTYPPFVWLPAVMVLAALAGHLLIFRALTQPPAVRMPHMRQASGR